MPRPGIPEDEFIELLQKHRSIAVVARITGISERAIASRRTNIEARTGMKFIVGGPGGARRPTPDCPTPRKHPRSLELGIENGQVLVFSDSHFHPGVRTTMFRGLLKAIELVRPKVVVANGDIFDGARVSRHNSLPFWEGNAPNVVQELRA